MAKPEPRGNQSVEVAARILAALVESKGPTTLSLLSEAAGLSPSRARSYLVGMVRVGLVYQDAEYGRYEFGPLAREVGLAALHRLDRLDTVDRGLAQLVADTSLTGSVATWSRNGPTVIRWQRSIEPLAVNVSIGSNLPVLTTALGRVFLAYLPRDVTLPFVTHELESLANHAVGYGVKSKRDVERLIAATRREGVARIEGTLMPDVSAVAAPVLNAEDGLEMVVGLVGQTNIARCLPDGEPLRSLLALTQALSHSTAGN